MTLTPWGKADDSHEIAVGITSYSTPSHGGIHLSPERQLQMPKELRIDSGWYEEDCDWCLVVAAFPEFFMNELGDALKTMMKWHPDRWLQHTKRRKNGKD
jgi:hypothetical protein